MKRLLVIFLVIFICASCLFAYHDDEDNREQEDEYVDNSQPVVVAPPLSQSQLDDRVKLNTKNWFVGFKFSLGLSSILVSNEDNDFKYNPDPRFSWGFGMRCSTNGKVLSLILDAEYIKMGAKGEIYYGNKWYNITMDVSYVFLNAILALNIENFYVGFGLSYAFLIDLSQEDRDTGNSLSIKIDERKENILGFLVTVGGQFDLGKYRVFFGLEFHMNIVGADKYGTYNNFTVLFNFGIGIM